MTTSTTYPNGQVLQSSAFTPSQISAFFQTLTYGMIGLQTPPPGSFQPVQIDWQTTGQPFVQTPAQDVCYLACVPVDVDYSKIRDRAYSGTGPITETWVYTRGWRISWVLYGPNSSDRARMIWSAMFMDYFADQMSLSNLFPVSEFNEPTRAPEEINKQFFERADFQITLYEQITETINDGVATSVDVTVYTVQNETSITA